MKTMKTKTGLALGLAGLTLVALLISNCGSNPVTDFTLNNPPAGFVFTNTAGNQIDKIPSGSDAQLRDTMGKIILQFSLVGSVNFQNVLAGRDSTRTFVHFPSSIDKLGLFGYLSLFLPCTAATDEVYVCPDAATMAGTATGCTGELMLTAANPTSGAYTWSNASTKTDIEDCQVKANVEDFGTGAFGASSAGFIVTEENLPDPDDEFQNESGDAGTE